MVTEKLSPNLFTLHGSQGIDRSHPDASGGRALALFGPSGGGKTSIYTAMLDPRDPIDDSPQLPRAGLGVGTGIRYVLPVGPASFDCALSPFPDTRAEGSLRWDCHLQLGYAF